MTRKPDQPSLQITVPSEQEGTSEAQQKISSTMHDLNALMQSARRNEERLREAQRVARIGSWERDLITDYPVWSEEMYRLYRFDPTDGPPTVEQTLARIHPEDLVWLLPILRDLEQNGGCAEYDIRLLFEDGTVTWGHAVTNIVCDETGRAVRRFGTLMDITERRKAEEQVKESEARFRAVFDNTAVGIAQATPDSKILMGNPAFAKMLGYSQEELIGRSFAEITHPDDREISRQFFTEVTDGKRDTYSLEKRYLRKDGSTVWAHLSSSAVRNTDGSLWFKVSVITDLTDRKRTEAQFLQAQKMESIGRLAGGIAHDYNNLLAIILGYAEVVEDGLAPGSELLASVHNIQGAANRAATVTRQLLAFARRQVSQLKVISPNDLLQTFSNLLKPLLTSNIELILLLNEGTGNLEIDPNHLEQIVMNLAVNARDAMPAGGKLILKTENISSSESCQTEWVEILPGNYVRLSVTDTGVGMTEEVKQHLFEPFFTTKEKGKGTGLGLATVYGLVKQAKGYVFAYSHLGTGTTFDLYLPAVERQVAPENEEMATVGTALTSGDTATILVVEDEPLVQELTVTTLRRAGYTVLVAANGTEALDLFNRHLCRQYPASISLVVTDAIMPGMSGRELVEQLRIDSPDLPVLIASGYTREGYTAQAALPAGVEFLQKPFTGNALLTKVRKLLSV